MVAVVKHWTMEKADGRTDALTNVRPSVVTLAKFFLNQIPQVPGLTIPAPAIDRIDELQAEVQTFGVPTPSVGRVDGGDGRPDPVGEEGCRTPPGAHIVDNNSIADHRAEEAEKRIQERDEELRQAHDELRRAREELAQNRADGEKQSRALEEELRKEFHDVEQRFALVESPDLSDISLPSFSLVLVETLRKTLDTEFELMKQLQSVQRATPGATTSEARKLTTKYTPPASPDRPPAEFQTPEGQATAMETDTPTTTLVERHQLDRLRADLELSRQKLDVARQEKERLEGRVRELSTQLDLVQPQLEQSRQEKEAADTQIRELATQLELA
ncbi:hypothetical protein R1flu_024533 [Riccia fluitans]|uniref:Uncharacterized protein n=1 Tax=Riccia fluitans TaxID=41844 RepID=A0ABD1XY51_9MARC